MMLLKCRFTLATHRALPPPPMLAHERREVLTPQDAEQNHHTESQQRKDARPGRRFKASRPRAIPRRPPHGRTRKEINSLSCFHVSTYPARPAQLRRWESKTAR